MNGTTLEQPDVAAYLEAVRSRLGDLPAEDQSGRPIDVLSGPEDTSRRVLAAGNGTQIFNSFPIRYFEPGTTEVAQPGLAPPIVVPQVETPPLELPAGPRDSRRGAGR